VASKEHTPLITLSLIAALTLAGAPTDDSKAPCEDAALSPFQVCEAMTAAVKGADMDVLVGHSSVYSRRRFNEKTKLALKGLHALLIGVRCVRVDSLDEKSDPRRALIWVYAPDGKSRDLPFVMENGFWRYDHERYEQLNKKK
jgi:hypothetical protein